MAGDQVKKRKKNPPDRKQPTWLFPEKEENPVLNPKPISEEQQRKADTERQNAIDFLKRRAYSVPDKPAPDPQLLNLIAVFLTEYGFNSTCRMFTTERIGRKKLNGWEDEMGGKVKPGTPRLGKIYNDWRKEWEERRGLEMTSSDEDDDAATKREKMIKRRENPKGNKGGSKDEQTSSSGSDESSGEGLETDVEMKDAPPTEKAKGAKQTDSDSSSSTPSSSSSSESDADDEKETKATKAPSPKPTVNNLVNKLKRKVASVSEPASDPPGKIDNEDKPSLAKKAKLDTKSQKTKTDKRMKADIENKKAESERKIDGAKLDNADEKRKADKKAKDKAGKKANSVPAVASTVGEPSSAEAPAGSASIDSAEGPARNPLPVSWSTSSSSSDSDSSSDSKSPPPKKVKSAKKAPKSTVTLPVRDDNPRKTSTDSSATLQDGETKKSTSVSSASSTSSSSSSDSESTPPPKKKSTSTGTTKRKSKSKDKHSSSTPTATITTAPTNDNRESTKYIKKQNTPFSRIPQDTQVDPRVASNAYVPYDYAERAHRDLVVTKGKGFTKEKNKKKRGSYRGGMIDVDGRKGIKFDD
ncbi:MAG: hypothetical protein M1830_002386 [Pleopsidium flavum]|nr:MAG: hypothetical protein M1830_002386 [Pleopsidium flavum]